MTPPFPKNLLRLITPIFMGMILIGIFFVPIVVSAQSGLVPCGLKLVGTAEEQQLCTICDLFVLFQRILNFIFAYVLGPVGALFLGWGGFMMIFPGAVGQASASSYQKGRTIISNVAVGIIIALLAWLVIDTILKALGAFQYGGSTTAQFGFWNQIECEAKPPEIPPVANPQQQTHKACAPGNQCINEPGPGPQSCPEACDGLKLICNTANQCQAVGIEGPNEGGCKTPGSSCGTACSPAALASKYGTSATNKNDPELDAFLACLDTKLSVVVSKGSVFTYEVEHPLCNQTRGDESSSCTPVCAHTKNSCHYGGATGSEGALAVDFGNEKAGTQIIQAAQQCPQTKAARCENANGQAVSCTSSSATHVHISTKKCSGS